MHYIERLHYLVNHADPLLLANPNIQQFLKLMCGNILSRSLDIKDLEQIFKIDHLFRILQTSGSSMRNCALDLVDNHPEFSSSQGMIRCYEVPPSFQWLDCEQAENAIGDALVMDTYKWTPDCFLVIAASETLDAYKMTTLLAYR